MLGHIFTDHPHKVGETYLEHQRFATGVGLRLLGAGLAALVHGLVPCLFTHTAGNMIARLGTTLGKRARPAPHADGLGAVP